MLPKVNYVKWKLMLPIDQMANTQVIIVINRIPNHVNDKYPCGYPSVPTTKSLLATFKIYF